MGWKTKVQFPAETKHFSLLHTVQTGSEAHRASYAIGRGRGVKLATHPHLFPRSRMAELYLQFLIRLHGVMLN
jgi:hypothetical protein